MVSFLWRAENISVINEKKRRVSTRRGWKHLKLGRHDREVNSVMIMVKGSICNEKAAEEKGMPCLCSMKTSLPIFSCGRVAARDQQYEEKWSVEKWLRQASSVKKKAWKCEAWLRRKEEGIRGSSYLACLNSHKGREEESATIMA